MQGKQSVHCDVDYSNHDNEDHYDYNYDYAHVVHCRGVQNTTRKHLSSLSERHLEV